MWMCRHDARRHDAQQRTLRQATRCGAHTRPAVLQVLESYMVPDIYNLVKYTPAVYGERDLMTVRAALLSCTLQTPHITPS